MKTSLVLAIMLVASRSMGQSWVDLRATALSNNIVDLQQTLNFDRYKEFKGYGVNIHGGRFSVYSNITEASPMWSKLANQKCKVPFIIGWTAYTIGVDQLIQKQDRKTQSFLYVLWCGIHVSQGILHNNRLGVPGFPVLSFHHSW